MFIDNLPHITRHHWVSVDTRLETPQAIIMSQRATKSEEKKKKKSSRQFRHEDKKHQLSDDMKTWFPQHWAHIMTFRFKKLRSGWRVKEAKTFFNYKSLSKLILNFHLQLPPFLPSSLPLHVSLAKVADDNKWQKQFLLLFIFLSWKVG